MDGIIEERDDGFKDLDDLKKLNNSIITRMDKLEDKWTNMKEIVNCNICCDAIKDHILPCGHAFCKECVFASDKCFHCNVEHGKLNIRRIYF